MRPRHHRADGSNGEHAVEKAQTDDQRRQRRKGCADAVERDQPQHGGRAKAPCGDPDTQTAAPQTGGHDPDGQHTHENTTVLRPAQLGGGAGAEAKDKARVGFKDQLLHEIGVHRQEDEKGEVARMRFSPDFA